MTQNQVSTRIKLKIISTDDWNADIVIVPTFAAVLTETSMPAKKVGDVVLKVGNPTTVMVSLGLQKNAKTSVFRKAGELTANWLISHPTLEVGLFPDDFSLLHIESALEAFCEGILLGAFRFDHHKSKDIEHAPITVQVVTDDETITKNLTRVAALVAGVNLAREWSHEPPNVINPVTLAERAQMLADETSLTCTIFDDKKLEAMGAGALLSVGLGSKTPSQMIQLEHVGTGADADARPIVVVGKAITFDTGGYSLKNTKGIVGMKFDKCGGMAVIGIMKAAAELDLPLQIIGLVPAAENMISSYAYRPNDIITSLSGKTIEIISTDAEGRMILSDALTYASTELQPQVIIDLATLTGGVLVALGKVRAGLMSTDDGLAEAVTAAGERSGERVWRLPLDEEYFELIKGSDSDLKNSAGKPLASSIVGGTFLKQFVMSDIPWAHIDIAGMAWAEKGGSTNATGFGVRLIVEYLQGLV